MPFAFAGHFSPENILPALALYRKNFTPCETLEKPYAMLAINIVAAETDAEAQKLATSQIQSFLNLVRGKPGKIQPPVESMEGLWTAQEKELVESRTGGSIVGSAETVKSKLEQLLDSTQADELMINSMMFDHQARLKSYKIIADIWQKETVKLAA